MKKFLVALCCLFCCHFAHADELTPSLTPNDIDLTASTAFQDGAPVGHPSAADIAVAMGLKSGTRDEGWSLDRIQHHTRLFRVNFTKPVQIGTILTTQYTGPDPELQFQPISGRFISYLKPGLPGPGDVTKDDEWIRLPAGNVKALPANTLTSALLFSDVPKGNGLRMNATTLGRNVVLQQRYYNALLVGNESHGGKEGTVETLRLSWNQEQSLSGVVIFSQNEAGVNASLLKEESKDNPLIAPDEDWSRVAWPAGQGLIVQRFAAPAKSRSLRVVAPAFNKDGSFTGIFPLTALGDTGQPPSTDVGPAPFSFTYQMPQDGFIAIDIHDKKTGNEVRHLVAEVAREKGPVQEHWDLKDDNGVTVPPGDYTFSAITRPPFKLTYEATVYNAGQPAWPAPLPGKGGGMWTADHTPPSSVTSVGDNIFIGSTYVESGDGLIATDHDGNKEWGKRDFAGFNAAERLASDGKNCYLMNKLLIDRVDGTTFKTDDIFDFNYTRDAPSNIWDFTHGGIVARGDKLYVASYSNPMPFLQSSFLADDVDTDKTMPSAWLRKGNGNHSEHDLNYAEGEYDEMMTLWATFNTERTPLVTRSLPDLPLPSNRAISYTAVKDGALANTVTLVLKKPVSVGSVVLPDPTIKVYVLKAGTPLDAVKGTSDDGPDVDLGGDIGGGPPPPADVFDPAIWIPLPVTRAGVAGLALAPKGGLKTQALRFKVPGKLDFAQVMSRRFADHGPDVQILSTEGDNVGPNGWSVTRPREHPINGYNPADIGLSWAAPVSLRGLTFIKPDAGQMYVDTFIGKGDPKAALYDDSQWQQVGFYEETLMGYAVPIPSLVNIDFGETIQTSALRVRFTFLQQTKNRGSATMQFGIGNRPNHVGFAGVLALESIGDDAQGLPQDLAQRITELKLPAADAAAGTQATVVGMFPFKEPGQMAVSPQGDVYCISAGDIVTVPLNADGGVEGTPKLVVKHAGDSVFTGFAVDKDGLMYVADDGPSKVIRIYDSKTGKQTGTIGTPGGEVVGPYDPTRFDQPTSVTIDSDDDIWVTDNSYQPKRTTRWSRDGKLLKVFMGTTQYGGGGNMDHNDKTTINYNGMKFKLNWTTWDWKLEALLFRGGAKGSIYGSSPDRALYADNKRFLVGDPGFQNSVATLCQEKDDIAIPRVAAGNLDAWDEIGSDPALRKKFGSLDLSQYSFIWTDKNSDGVPQPDEVQISDKLRMKPVGQHTRSFGDDLSLNFDSVRIPRSGWLPSGAPDYDITKFESLPAIDTPMWVTADGRAFQRYDRMLAPDGKTVLWTFRDKWTMHDGFYAAAYGYDRPPGELVCEFDVIGHLTVKTKDGPEELFVTNSDGGDWPCFTSDGLLVGCIFGGPPGYGLRRWTMPDWRNDKVSLDDVRLPQEHYQGDVEMANDGQVYAIAGHNHISVVHVQGLEDMQRVKGEFSVTATDQAKTAAWVVDKAVLEAAHEEPKLTKMPYLQGAPTIDASLNDWPDDQFVTIHDYWQHSAHLNKFITYAKGALAYDSKNLYVAAWTIDDNGMRNSADDLTHIFQAGDGLDVLLGTDPTADPKRRGPVPGDVRIVISQVNGKPVAELFRFKDPKAAAAQRVHYTSPVGEAWVDDVEQIKDANISIKTGTFKDGDGWIVEAAIPWAAIGVPAPRINEHLRGDLGILQSDQNGVRTTGRLYWSGKSQNVVSDTPSEARVTPSFWGDVYTTEADKASSVGGLGDNIDLGLGMDGP